MDPLVFEPCFRPQIWGGRRLERYLGKRLPGEGPFGEAWMLSAQPWHVSRVAEGPLHGTPLSELWASRAKELIGRELNAVGQFPLLVKFLDCQELLSIQVHPNDEVARRLCPGESGKTEAWVVLQADAAARIYAGLRRGTTRGVLETHLDAGTLAECLHWFVPQPGQCIFLPAGTVHAVGGGVLLAEVQQTSEATFRLFDWNRLGPDGQPRPLHQQEALWSIDWSAGPVGPIAGSAVAALPQGNRGEHLVACRYFSIDRFQLAAPLDLPYPERLSIWMMLEGSAWLTSEATGYRRLCGTADTVLVPASARGLRWTPAAEHRGATLLAALPP
jgi:mannose-6-phosphate isomerase